MGGDGGTYIFYLEPEPKKKSGAGAEEKWLSSATLGGSLVSEMWWLIGRGLVVHWFCRCGGSLSGKCEGLLVSEI